MQFLFLEKGHSFYQWFKCNGKWTGIRCITMYHGIRSFNWKFTMKPEILKGDFKNIILLLVRNLGNRKTIKRKCNFKRLSVFGYQQRRKFCHLWLHCDIKPLQNVVYAVFVIRTIFEEYSSLGKLRPYTAPLGGKIKQTSEGSEARSQLWMALIICLYNSEFSLTLGKI